MRDREFCSSAHRKRYQDRLNRALGQADVAGLRAVRSADFFIEIPPQPGAPSCSSVLEPLEWHVDAAERPVPMPFTISPVAGKIFRRIIPSPAACELRSTSFTPQFAPAKAAVRIPQALGLEPVHAPLGGEASTVLHVVAGTPVEPAPAAVHAKRSAKASRKPPEVGDFARLESVAADLSFHPRAAEHAPGAPALAMPAASGMDGAAPSSQTPKLAGFVPLESTVADSAFPLRAAEYLAGAQTLAMPAASGWNHAPARLTLPVAQAHAGSAKDLSLSVPALESEPVRPQAAASFTSLEYAAPARNVALPGMAAECAPVFARLTLPEAPEWTPSNGRLAAKPCDSVIVPRHVIGEPSQWAPAARLPLPLAAEACPPQLRCASEARSLEFPQAREVAAQTIAALDAMPFAAREALPVMPLELATAGGLEAETQAGTEAVAPAAPAAPALPRLVERLLPLALREIEPQPAQMAAAFSFLPGAVRLPRGIEIRHQPSIVAPAYGMRAIEFPQARAAQTAARDLAAPLPFAGVRTQSDSPQGPELQLENELRSFRPAPDYRPVPPPLPSAPRPGARPEARASLTAFPARPASGLPKELPLDAALEKPIEIDFEKPPRMAGFVELEYFCHRVTSSKALRFEWSMSAPQCVTPAFPQLNIAGKLSDLLPKMVTPFFPAAKTRKDMSRWRRRGMELAAAAAVVATFIGLGLRIATVVGSAPSTASNGREVALAPIVAAPVPQPSAGPITRLRHAIANRAAVEVSDSFQAGMEAWGHSKGMAPGWSRNPSGYVEPGQLALFHPTMKFTDYRMEFFGQIESKSMDWVVRAHDPNNYYAMKFTVIQKGLRPLIAMVHYPVINGKPGKRSMTPLNVMIHNNEPYRVGVSVEGNHIITSIEGQEVDRWIEDSVPSGGVGFFSEAGERARLYWMKVAKNQDFLGKVCAYLTGSSSGQRDVAMIPLQSFTQGLNHGFQLYNTYGD